MGHIGSGAYPSTHSVGISGAASENNEAQCEDRYISPFVSRLRINGAIPLSPPLCLRGVNKDN